MTGLALSLALAASMVGEVKSYASAYASAQESGKPMLVLIGAEWCPGCRTMKSQVMPRMSAAGKLKNVEFAVVDTDREDALSDKLLRGNLIPQLVLITKTPDGWQRQYLTGAQSEESVATMINQGLAKHVSKRQDVVPASATEPAKAPR
jgi:thiol-disulfide isomerase/thioredoxin